MKKNIFHVEENIIIGKENNKNKKVIIMEKSRKKIVNYK